MTRNRITQREAIFYQLYKAHKERAGQFIPVFALMGEVWCAEVRKWGFVSYECSARASELIKENPTLIERTTITGKSGAKYYGYRIRANVTQANISDSKLLVFYKAMVDGKKRMAKMPQCAHPDLDADCSGCTDGRSEGTHQGCTRQHGHVGCNRV